MLPKFALNALTWFWYSGIAAIIYFGWSVRDQRYLVAESGIGYWLGIFGGSMMLLLLVYPIRKRKPRWRYAGSVKFWFRTHMFFGIAGPVLIIFHSGYRLGSLNGSVAIISMLIVAGSGLVGRYLYRRIHHGLYGEKIRFEELYRRDENWQQQLTGLKQKFPDLLDELLDLEQKLVHRHTGVNRSLLFYLSMRWKLRHLRSRTGKALDASDRKKMLNRLWNLRSISNLGINEILFSYWHILHFPLFLMLVISGFTHVAVVHFY